MKSKSGDNLSFNEKYIIKEKKGKGGFGKAYVICNRENQEEFVAKCNIKPEDEESFKEEIKVLTELNKSKNPNIIKLIESGETNIEHANHEGETTYMILEYAKNRELFDYIGYARKGFGETFGKIIFKKILNGMRTIHELGYCHKDLSLSNIFLDENYEPKIADFGTAMKNRDDLEKFISTPGFKAPEIIRKEPHNGQMADIFSLGQILIYIVFGKPGFENPDRMDPWYKLIIEKEEKEKIEEKEECLKNYWLKMGTCLGFEEEIISDEFKDLYMNMVCPEPEKRLTIQEILEHPWIKSAGDIIDENLRKEFIKRIPKIEDEIKKEIIKDMKDDKLLLNDNKLETRSIEGEKVFNTDKEPKNIPDYYNDRFSIKFKEYSKDNANQIMNNLHAKIINKYKKENNYEIECSPDKFKMDITFEDEQEETIEMKIKLYQFKDG